MIHSEPPAKGPGRRLGKVVGWGLLGLLLCAATAVAGYWLGRSSVSPQMVTQVQEVTRQVTAPASTVLAQAEPTAVPQAVARAETAAAVDIPTEPTPQPTAVAQQQPLPTPTATKPFTPRTEAIRDIDFQLFYEVWELMLNEYDGQIPANEELLYSAIDGAISSLSDDHTRFVRPETARRIRESQGPVEGIGAIVTENDEGQIEIVRPLDGQPADLAGVRAGDVLIAVDGQSVEGQGLDEVVLLVRGPSGTAVTITVRRPEVVDPLDFTITRTRFEVPVVEAELLPEGIAYIRLSTFLDQTAAAETEAVLEQLLVQNPTGIIFDLRDNGGGYLGEAISIADLFLPQGPILMERNIRGLNETFSAESGDIGEALPLVVLVNAGSASASEIVAGAIKDNERGVLIGEKTFGKGSVQQVHTLSNGAEIRITIARWFTPNNISIDDQGIVPDVEVATPEDLGGETDTQLQRAIEYLQTENGTNN